MKLLLLSLLLRAQPTVVNPSDTCYCHGKFYVKENNVVIDSFSMLQKLFIVKHIKDDKLRESETDKLLHIRHCE